MAIITAVFSANITANIAAISSKWSAHGTTFIEAKRATDWAAIITAIGATYITTDGTAI